MYVADRDTSFPADFEKRAHLARKHRHILRHHDAGSGWQHCHQIIGGHNVTAVLAKTDGNGNVTDRAVVKDTWHLLGEWTQADAWTGDVGDTTQREPRELTIYKCLQALQPASREWLSRVRSAKVLNDRRVVRLYLDYCDRNDAMYFMTKN
jgi:hypothetical protein